MPMVSYNASASANIERARSTSREWPASRRTTRATPAGRCALRGRVGVVDDGHMIQIDKIVEELRASGQPVTDEDLARLSPLLRTRVIPNGSYDVSIP